MNHPSIKLEEKEDVERDGKIPEKYGKQDFLEQQNFGKITEIDSIESN